MKNMAVLIDSNVLLNYITNRNDKYLNESIKIVEFCALGKLSGYKRFTRFLPYGMYWERSLTKSVDII